MATLFALIFILAAAVTLYGITIAARALFRRGDTAHQISAPSGVWTSKVLWTGRSVADGPVAQMVKQLTGSTPSKDSVEKPKQRNRLGEWGDFLSGFDEVFIWLAGAVAVVALALAVVVMILIAIEIAVLMLVGTLLGGLRAVRAHPWTIEVIDPLGAISEVKVRGFRNARRRHNELRQQIIAGDMTIAQISDS